MTVFSISVSQILSSLSLPSAHLKQNLITGSDHISMILGSAASRVVLAINWINLAGTVGAFSSLIPLIIGLRKFARLDPGLRLLTINLLIAVLVEIIGYTLMATIKHNQVVYSLYTPVEFIIFVLMFRHWLKQEKLKKVLTLSIPISIVLWAGGNLWFLIQGDWMNSQLVVNDLFLSIQSVFFIIISIMTLLNIINDVSTPAVRNPVFWVTTAILFYFTGNLFIFTFLSIILGDSDLLLVWYLHSALNFLKSILFAIGLAIAGTTAIEGQKTGEETQAD